jgi:hypothetical protein
MAGLRTFVAGCALLGAAGCTGGVSAHVSASNAIAHGASTQLTGPSSPSAADTTPVAPTTETPVDPPATEAPSAAPVGGEHGPVLSSTFRDPFGRFEIAFPSTPAQTTRLDEGKALAVKITSLMTKSADFTFMFGYSDAPAGVPLVSTQVLPDSVAKENADNDGGKLVNSRPVTMFGQPALEFEVEATDGQSRYHDVSVVLGGRRYELTVSQLASDRGAFDAFVASFHLLQPPMKDGAQFFVAAERLCAAFTASRPPRPADESVVQHVDAIRAVVQFQQSLVDTLSATAANPDEQGAASAFIDAVRRSGPAGLAYINAIQTADPNADAIGRSSSADLDLAYQIAAAHGAPSCP